MQRNLFLLLITVMFFTISCQKGLLDSREETVEGEGGLAPKGFDYSTTSTVTINVRLLAPDNKPLGGVLTSISYVAKENVEISKVISDKDGYVKATVVVPSYVEELIIDPAYIGVIRNAKVKTNTGTVNLILGGTQGYIGDLVLSNEVSSKSATFSKLGNSLVSATGTVYNYNPAKFDALGRPLNLEGVDNSVNFVELLRQINASLPERKEGIYLHPEYISTSAPSNLSITKLSDVWITFVHEGADYTNSLGYYTYPTGNKPSRAADIDSIHLIFPNASLLGHTGAGNMRSGDKVKIGRFPAGTSVGFVLVQKGYNKDGTFNPDAIKFYSDESFNSEADVTLKRHNVLLNSQSQKLFLVGFEDIRRDLVTCDNDFNDLIFFAQSNPVNAIDPTNIPYLEERVEDTDGDGVPDINDEYPNDPERAYNRFYPSENIWGTLAFEDQWPVEGDYDLNDLVVRYRYKFVMNSQNKLQDIVSEFKPIAAGAVFANGFGVEIPQRASTVRSVTGQKITENYVTLAAGTRLEAGHTNSVIIPFDNHKSLFKSPASYLNTVPQYPVAKSDTVKVVLTFSSPQFDAFTAKVPFNPFLISKGTRGREVHLVNNAPTALADLSLLGTGNDRSDASSSSYYLTAERRPFALNFTGAFDYPTETNSIYDAYKHFSEWALSGGRKQKDWYLNLPGNRDASKIYLKK